RPLPSGRLRVRPEHRFYGDCKGIPSLFVHIPARKRGIDRKYRLGDYGRLRQTATGVLRQARQRLLQGESVRLRVTTGDHLQDKRTDQKCFEESHHHPARLTAARLRGRQRVWLSTPRQDVWSPHAADYSKLSLSDATSRTRARSSRRTGDASRRLPISAPTHPPNNTAGTQSMIAGGTSA